MNKILLYLITGLFIISCKNEDPKEELEKKHSIMLKLLLLMESQKTEVN